MYRTNEAMGTGELYKVSAQEARVQLSDLINRALYGRQPSLITRQGKPAAVLISFEQWQEFQQAQQIESLAPSESFFREQDADEIDQPLNNNAKDEQAVEPFANQ